ncbi:unnamed protein product [Angiostrongylus costaricensis]|uniref:TAFH domain-containing protein n=1 Tax=Angiostrongylus costaricensis TaxID=334426 RepID=A0A0R3PFQ6_ANGCS|nr:unnamed protein product [Angiostrongylus costaricensis]
MIFQLLVNSEIPIDQFAALVERTVKANASPNLLPFLHRTVPAFIEAIAQCRINVEYLLPYYLKPLLQPTETRSYQDYSTPSRETPAAVVPVYPEATCQLSVHSLHPNCDSSQTASCENTFTESLSDLFLHPYGMLASIQKCMGTSFYVEEEALQLISYAAENHIREILIEMTDVAAHRVKGLLEPGKTYRKVVRVIASDLKTVVLGDKRLFG